MSSEPGADHPMEDIRSGSKKQPSPNLACEACRALKIKCYPSDPEVTAKCQRCAKRNETCIHKIPTRRKQRKRIDTQIKELEKEVIALSTMLKDRDAERSSSDRTTRSTSALISHHSEFDDVDALPDGLENECFDRFVQELMPTFPVISFPPGTHAWHVREDTPILFQAIVAVASSPYGEELSKNLNQKIIKTLAELVVAEGQKRLELAQALLVVNAFYYPPRCFSRLKHYQYVQLAAAILHDLDLARPCVDTSHYAKPLTGLVGFGDLTQCLDPTSLDSRRTVLACYTISAGISHTMRRASPFPYNSWIEQCMTLLESSGPDNYNDRKLAAFARLNRIAEDYYVNMGQDKNESITFSDPVTQHHVRQYNQRLLAWYNQVDSDLLHGSLSVSFYAVKIYVNEVALYFDHNVDDFHPPYAIAAHRRESEHLPRPPPPAAYMESIMICIASAQNAIEAFLSINVEKLRATTTITFVRMMYSIVVLAKLSGSLTASRSILAQKLEVEKYILRLIKHLELVIQSGQCLIGDKFPDALRNMVSWHNENKADASRLTVDGNILQPLRIIGETGPPLAESVKALQDRYNSIAAGRTEAWEQQDDLNAVCNSGQSPSPTPDPTRIPMDTSIVMSAWQHMDARVPDFPPLPADFDANFDFDAIENVFNFPNGVDGFGNYCHHAANANPEGEVHR